MMENSLSGILQDVHLILYRLLDKRIVLIIDEAQILTNHPHYGLRMLAEIVFEKINFGKQFRIHNIFHIKDHQKTT